MARSSPRNSRRHDPDPARIAAALCKWFDHHARDLPWRRKRTGYTALVAEAMLQQTQVARVVEYFDRFIKRFPTVHALAAAEERDVLSLWQGLGYYRRARNLHRAAKMIVTDCAGRVPRQAHALRQLPGIGRYTAGAIASIVFNEREPIVDGNVQRVLARWFAKASSPQSKQMIEWTWRKAGDLVAAAARPGVFNEAMMELGATICTPRAPQCARCPVAKHCEAQRLGLQDRIPAAKSRAKPQAAHHHAVILTRNGTILLQQRGDRGMWSNMWQTPTIEADRPMSEIELKQSLPIRVHDLHLCGSFDHHTTHRRIRFHVYRASTRTRRGIWQPLNQLGNLPMSNAQRRILRIIQNLQTI